MPFPQLESKRLILRQLKVSDLNEIFSIRSNAEISEFLDRPLAKTLDEAGKFITKINKGIKNNEWIYWALAPKHENKLIGTICLWKILENKNQAEIGFELLPEYQGKGLMQEALSEVLEYGFNTMGLNKIDGEVDPRNIKSIRLMLKNGFVKTIDLGHNKSEEGKILNTVVFTLLNVK
ncbi:MAG: N-acetyltransferase [Ignavibacteriae bacterium HGW-Ignavibacteriae-2]|jgi:ribosomal-protein-alanine N-acetyltransferase|nr:MAG: N-acetyltransferase [Ignavibacteriae bacterium HGW-Ignavibacteriae-2]